MNMLSLHVLSATTAILGASTAAASSAPSVVPTPLPSVSMVPTVQNSTNATNVTMPPSAMPSISHLPSASPTVSFPPTVNATHPTASHSPSMPPSVSPAPSFSPTSTSDKNNNDGGAGLIHKLLKAVGWTIVALIAALGFGWLVSNHRRVLPLVGEMWYRIRNTDWLRFVSNVASNVRELSGGLYHRLRFGRRSWSFRGGGRDYDTVPLNEVIFEDGGDPTELLLSRER